MLSKSPSAITQSNLIYTQSFLQTRNSTGHLEASSSSSNIRTPLKLVKTNTSVFCLSPLSQKSEQFSHCSYPFIQLPYWVLQRKILSAQITSFQGGS